MEAPGTDPGTSRKPSDNNNKEIHFEFIFNPLLFTRIIENIWSCLRESVSAQPTSTVICYNRILNVENHAQLKENTVECIKDTSNRIGTAIKARCSTMFAILL